MCGICGFTRKTDSIVHRGPNEDGVNGFLADSEEEWVRKISRLIENPELLRKIGLAGRKTIEENFSTEIDAPKYLEIIKNISR